MKLYFSPGACSLSPHIVLREAGLQFETSQVNLKTHQLADGTDFYTINPKGYVPVLELDNGQRLTENAAIVQWVADQVPQIKLAPPAGSMEHYRMIEWLSFVGTEVHKNFSPLFNPAMPDEAKALGRTRLVERYRYVDKQLAGKSYLMGETFTAADAYLFVVTRWAAAMKVDVSTLDHLGQFMKTVSARPAVQQAMQAEGLSK